MLNGKLILYIFFFLINLNLKKSNLSEESWRYLDEKLIQSIPCPMIIKLKWEYNLITTKILNYISKLPFLEELSLSKCYFDQIDIILNNFINLISLTKFKIHFN